jgi:polysaccharide pyruvyl transferase WcaK-like protein
VLTGHQSNPEQQPGLAQVALEVAEATLEAFPGESVKVWSTVQGHLELAGEDDSLFAASVIDRLTAAQRDRVTVLHDYLSPAEAIALVGDSRSIVSMRMHPALFAATLDIPFCLVLGAQKAGVLEATSLRDRVVNPADPATIAEGIARAVGRPGRGQWRALDPLRHRMIEVRARLADFLEGLVPVGSD